MIARAYITEWQQYVPWPTPAQVEQDLLLSRFIVEIANDELLGEEIAFRGGTALHKLHLPEPLRYSEDLDYVRTTDTPVGQHLDALRTIGARIGLEESRRNVRQEMLTMLFYAAPTVGPEGSRIRIKVETNQAETSPLWERIHREYDVQSRWWSGKARVLTFKLEELMGTKLRALYQRSKGRDLFDLWHVLDERRVDDEQVVDALRHYMNENTFTYRQLAPNLKRKLDDPDFVADLDQLVTERPSRYEVIGAADVIMERLGSHLKYAPPLGEIADGAWRQ